MTVLGGQLAALLAVLLSAAAVVLLLPPGPGTPARRLARLRPPRPAASPPQRPAGPRGAGAAAGLAGLGLAGLVGGPLGLALGVAAAVLVYRTVQGLPSRSARAQRRRLHRDLPVLVDLLAAVLVAGASVPAGVEAAATAVGGPVAARLQPPLRALRLGADPAAVWSTLGGDPVLGPLGRALGRVAVTGAPLAPTVLRLADAVRATRRAQREAAARRVGVLAVLPLGLCFLPAFVLVGVLPVVLAAVAALR